MVYITGYHSLFNFHLHFDLKHSCTYTRIGYFWDPGCKGTAGAIVLKWTITPSKTAPKLRMGGPCAICSLTRISQACRLALTFPIKRISHLLPFLSPPHACIILIPTHITDQFRSLSQSIPQSIEPSNPPLPNHQCSSPALNSVFLPCSFSSPPILP